MGRITINGKIAQFSAKIGVNPDKKTNNGLVEVKEAKIKMI